MRVDFPIPSFPAGLRAADRSGGHTAPGADASRTSGKGSVWPGDRVELSAAAVALLGAVRLLGAAEALPGQGAVAAGPQGEGISAAGGTPLCGICGGPHDTGSHVLEALGTADDDRDTYGLKTPQNRTEPQEGMAGRTLASAGEAGAVGAADLPESAVSPAREGEHPGQVSPEAAGVGEDEIGSDMPGVGGEASAGEAERAIPLPSGSSGEAGEGTLTEKGTATEVTPGARGEANEETAGATAVELSEEEKAEVENLKDRDREVRTHEQAHVAAGGQYVRGRAQFEYASGPDGRRYAVGGEVSIDTSSVPGDPQASIRKAQVVRRAAMAPAHPSTADYRVAAAASRMESEARRELTKSRMESGDTEADEAVETAEDMPMAAEKATEMGLPGGASEAEDRVWKPDLKVEADSLLTGSGKGDSGKAPGAGEALVSGAGLDARVMPDALPVEGTAAGEGAAEASSEEKGIGGVSEEADALNADEETSDGISDSEMTAAETASDFDSPLETEGLEGMTSRKPAQGIADKAGAGGAPEASLPRVSGPRTARLDYGSAPRLGLVVDVYR